MREMVAELVHYRQLLWSLAWRDIRVRYKQSLLGIAWAMFIPLAMMGVFTVINTVVFKIPRERTMGLPYPVFAYMGLLPWTFFARASKVATNSLVANRNLVTKIYFPREVFPLSAIVASLVDFGVGAFVLAGLMIVFGTPVHATLLLLPMVVLVEVLFCAGISFFLSMGNLFYRDVRMVYEVIVMLWMFATNVIYPLETGKPTVDLLIKLNPMTPIISAYRSLAFAGTLDVGAFGYAAAVAVLLCITGWVAFHKAEFIFAERI